MPYMRCANLARLFDAVGDKAKQAVWLARANQLTQAFSSAFWRKDHFAEYIHAERGPVDSHGLSDVNWAAVGLGVASGHEVDLLWPLLMKETGFWRGDMPSLSVTRPFSYEKWELNEPVPFEVNPLNDVAAMGRVWYVEAAACQRTKANDRLLEACAPGVPRGEGRRPLARAVSSTARRHGQTRRRGEVLRIRGGPGAGRSWESSGFLLVTSVSKKGHEEGPRAQSLLPAALEGAARSAIEEATPLKNQRWDVSDHIATDGKRRC